jgi:hypothetical protein
MKKYALVLAILGLAAVAWAQDQDLKAKYDSQKMTILSDTENMSSKSWSVTKGYEVISEARFLHLAGFEEESKLSQSNVDFDMFMGNVLWIGLGTGLGLDLYGTYLMTSYPVGDLAAGDKAMKEGSTVMYTGLGILLASVVVPFFFSKPVPISPLGKATQIARDYNDALLASLSK